MKRVLTLLLAITLLLPNIPAKAAEATQYIDVFIPYGIIATYERGKHVYYDPEGTMQEEWENHLAGNPGKIPLVLWGALYTKENQPSFHDGSVYGSTDFPYATMTYEANGNIYTSLEDVKKNESKYCYTMTLDKWNEINSQFDIVRNLIDENVIRDETGLIIDCKNKGVKEVNSNNETYNILKKYNKYYTIQYPRKTYFYGQDYDQSGTINDKFYTNNVHTFTSLYDWYTYDHCVTLMSSVGYQDMSPIYYNMNCHETEVQPVGNYKYNINDNYYNENCYYEHMFPEAISEPYTVENNEYHYNTTLPKVTTLPGETPTTEATTQATTTEQPKTEVTTEKSTDNKTTEEVTTEKVTIDVKTEVTTEETKTTEATTEKATEVKTEATTEKVEEPVNKKITQSNVTYKINGKTASVVKGKNVKSITIKSTIEYNGVKYNVVSIEANAFKNCTKMKSVVIGKNVKTINKHSFYNCKNLKKVTFKHSNKDLKKIKFKTNAFKNTHKKLKIEVSKNVTKSTKKTFLKTIKKYGNKNVSYK